MAAVLYDTLRLSRTLREKGRFTPEQAEALAEALGEASHEDLATKADVGGVKSDIAGVESRLKADIAGVESGLKTDIAGVESGLKAEIARGEADLKAEIARVETELKGDIAQVRAELKADIAQVEAGLKTDIAVIKARVTDLATKAELADLKTDILKWMVGAIGFQTAVIVGALVSLVRIFAK